MADPDATSTVPQLIAAAAAVSTQPTREIQWSKRELDALKAEVDSLEYGRMGWTELAQRWHELGEGFPKRTALSLRRKWERRARALAGQERRGGAAEASNERAMQATTSVAQHRAVLLARLAELERSVADVKAQLVSSEPSLQIGHPPSLPDPSVVIFTATRLTTEDMPEEQPLLQLTPVAVTTATQATTTVNMNKRHLVIYLEGDREMYRLSANVLANALQVGSHTLFLLFVSMVLCEYKHMTLWAVRVLRETWRRGRELQPACRLHSSNSSAKPSTSSVILTSPATWEPMQGWQIGRTATYSSAVLWHRA